jgi:hypothetical protein
MWNWGQGICLQLRSKPPPVGVSLSHYSIPELMLAQEAIYGFSLLVSHAARSNDCTTRSGSLVHLQNSTVKTLGKSSLFIRGISATLRQTSPDKEIKSTTTETATVNQLPQSGITWDWSPMIIHSTIVEQPSSLTGITDSSTSLGLLCLVAKNMHWHYPDLIVVELCWVGLAVNAAIAAYTSSRAIIIVFRHVRAC